jgi:hypothetical protein
MGGPLFLDASPKTQENGEYRWVTRFITIPPLDFPWLQPDDARHATPG